MNTRMLLVVGFVTLPVLAATAQWGTNPQINVSGSAELKVVPDEVDLTGVITNGVNHVLRVEFGTSELRKYKDQARAKAVQAAKEKAQAMASALGVKVGKPFNITVNDWSAWTGWSPPGSWAYGGGGGFGGGAQNVSQSAGGGSGDTGPTVAVGQISVSASVSVTFLIE